MAKHMGQFP